MNGPRDQGTRIPARKAKGGAKVQGNEATNLLEPRAKGLGNGKDPKNERTKGPEDQKTQGTRGRDVEGLW